MSKMIKAKSILTDTSLTKEEQLFEQFSKLTPEFSNKETARAHYLNELEVIATKHNSTVEDLVITIDRKNTWSEEERYFMRLSKLIFTFQ